MRQHLSVVRSAAGSPGARRIGPYELLGPATHIGLPGLWFARREAPPYLAGPSLLVPLDGVRDPEEQERAVRAARRAQVSRHPALVRVEEIVAAEGELALVLEAVDGASLGVLLAESSGLAGAFRAEHLLELGARLLEALHDLHTLPPAPQAARAHGDVGLDTVLFCPDGQVRLIGFGLPPARGGTRLDTRWNLRAPTRADEQALDLPALGDQFAVGLLLLQLATGRTLAAEVPTDSTLSERGAAVERLLRRLDLREPLMPGLLRLLAPDPSHRFADALEAAAALRHPRGPWAAEELEALVRRAVADARRPVTRQEDPEDDPSEITEDALPAVAATGLDLSRTHGSDEAGMGRAVARAWDDPPPAQPHDPTLPKARDPSLAQPHDPTEPSPDPPSAAPLSEAPGSFVAPADDSLDVWAGDLDMPVSPGVEADTGALSVDDLEEVAGDWFLDEDPEDAELARTAPGAEVPRGPEGGGRRRVEPGRTVPYSPAFVPKSAAFRDEEPPAPELSPGALGLLSGVMPSVQRPAPEASQGSEPPTDPAALTPLATAAVSVPPDDDDRTTPFGGSRPTEASVADVPASEFVEASGAPSIEAPAPTSAPPRSSASVAGRFEAPVSVPGELPPGPAWVTPSAALSAGEDSAVRAAALMSMSVTGPMPTPGGAPGPRGVPVASPAGETLPPRRRRRRPKGTASRRGASIGVRSLPRVWREQTILTASPVARGVALGILILLMIGLVEGVRRRVEASRAPAETTEEAAPLE